MRRKSSLLTARGWNTSEKREATVLESLAGQHLHSASLSLARLARPRRLCQQKTVVEQRLVRAHTEKVM